MILREEHISSLVGQQGSDDGWISFDVEESKGLGETEGNEVCCDFDIGTGTTDNAVKAVEREYVAVVAICGVVVVVAPQPAPSQYMEILDEGMKLITLSGNIRETCI